MPADAPTPARRRRRRDSSGLASITAALPFIHLIIRWLQGYLRPEPPGGSSGPADRRRSLQRPAPRGRRLQLTPHAAATVQCGPLRSIDALLCSPSAASLYQAQERHHSCKQCEASGRTLAAAESAPPLAPPLAPPAACRLPAACSPAAALTTLLPFRLQCRSAGGRAAARYRPGPHALLLRLARGLGGEVEWREQAHLLLRAVAGLRFQPLLPPGPGTHAQERCHHARLRHRDLLRGAATQPG